LWAHPQGARNARTAWPAYTRKSTEDGLEQEFNSLDAQRGAGEAYIASKKSEGWVCLPDRYDDGDFTGGNMERPALKRLLADIEDGKGDAAGQGGASFLGPPAATRLRGARQWRW